MPVPDFLIPIFGRKKSHVPDFGRRGGLNVVGGQEINAEQRNEIHNPI